jgi:hypothetical protein
MHRVISMNFGNYHGISKRLKVHREKKRDQAEAADLSQVGPNPAAYPGPG